MGGQCYQAVMGFEGAVPGDWIVTSSGRAVVTRIEQVGLEQVYWADYGSGIAQPHVRADVTCGLKIVLGGPVGEEPSNPTEFAPAIGSRARGWIGWKETKRQRKNRKPWVCRQAWLYWEETGGKKRSCYIPKAKLALVEESVYRLKRPLAETLALLGKE